MKNNNSNISKMKCNCHYQCGCDEGECNCYTLDPMKTQNKTKDWWEVEFYKNLKVSSTGLGKWSGLSIGGNPRYDFEKIVAFIKELLSQTKQQTLEQILPESKIKLLTSLRELCIEEDLLDINSYGGIERAEKIQQAWEALKVIEELGQATNSLKEV